MQRNGFHTRMPLSSLSPNATAEQTVSRRVRSGDRDVADVYSAPQVVRNSTNNVFCKLPSTGYPNKLRTLDNADIARFEANRKQGIRGSTGSLSHSKELAWRIKKASDVKPHPPPPPFPRMKSAVTPGSEPGDEMKDEVTLAPRASTTLGFSDNRVREEIPVNYMLSGTIWRKQRKLFRRWRKCHAYMNALHLAVSPRNFSGVIQIKNQEQIILSKSTCIKVGRAQGGIGDRPNWIFHLYTENGHIYVFAVATEQTREMWVNNLNAAARTLKHVGVEV